MSEVFKCPKCERWMQLDNFNGMYLCPADRDECVKAGCYVSYYDLRGRAR